MTVLCPFKYLNVRYFKIADAQVHICAYPHCARPSQLVNPGYAPGQGEGRTAVCLFTFTFTFI